VPECTTQTLVLDSCKLRKPMSKWRKHFEDTLPEGTRDAMALPAITRAMMKVAADVLGA
jgi:hypothetical protein